MQSKYKSYWRKSGLKGKWGNIFLERISLHNPKNVLEIGVFCGVTARNICDLLNKENGNNFNYIGEWTREMLYKSLTKYSTLVLLSKGEAHALVICEALVAGLGLVISEEASSNLDKNKEFIDIISIKHLNNSVTSGISALSRGVYEHNRACIFNPITKLLCRSIEMITIKPYTR